MTHLMRVTCVALALMAIAAAWGQVAEPVLSQDNLLSTFTMWAPPLQGTRDEPRVPRGYGWDTFPATPAPPAEWMAPDFAAEGWTRNRHPLPIHGRGQLINLALLAVRGDFWVDDPAVVRGLSLGITYRGGAIIYLNGKEISRQHLPAGALTPTALADDYPEEAFVDEGKALTRELTVALPTGALRAGRNVLAVELHRATHRASERARAKYGTAELLSLQLTAQPAGTVTARPAAVAAMRVWNASAIEEVDEAWHGDWTRSLQPMRLVGPRNATVSGQVVISGDAPVTGARASISDFAWAGERPELRTIPTADVQIRYGARGSLLAHDPAPVNSPYYDVLSPEPVEGARNQPVWVTVPIPTDLPAGSYAATLTVAADGLAPTSVPVSLTVSPWHAPSPKEFTTHVGLMETPEQLALKYQVPLWSEAHWQLIEASLKQLGKVGADVIYLPLITNTHLGNSQTMVRWVKQGDGYVPDFTIAERYLDMWLRYVGTPEYVCLYVWDFYLGGQGGSIGNVNTGSPMGKECPVPITGYDPATGEITALTTPPYGEPGSETFWQAALDGLKARLARRGLSEEQIILGHGADARPNTKQLAFWTKIAPYAKWVLRSHTPTPDINGTPVRFAASPWGYRPPMRYVPGKLAPAQPTYALFNYPRDYSRGDTRPSLGNTSPPFTYRRVVLSSVLAANTQEGGIAGVGVDYWDQTLYKGFLGWGHLGVRCASTYVLAPGPRGPLATVRLEMLREGLQEAEACKVLMMALSDPARRAQCTDAQITQAQALLDRYCEILYMAGMHQELYENWGWQQRSQELFDLAAEIGQP